MSLHLHQLLAEEPLGSRPYLAQCACVCKALQIRCCMLCMNDAYQVGMLKSQNDNVALWTKFQVHQLGTLSLIQESRQQVFKLKLQGHAGIMTEVEGDTPGKQIIREEMTRN